MSLVLVFGVFVLPVVARVDTAPTGPTNIEGLIDIIDKIVDWAFAILIAVAAFMIIYAGFGWMTAAGDSDKLDNARKTLIYALVGVGVAVLAKGLVAIVKTLVTG